MWEPGTIVTETEADFLRLNAEVHSKKKTDSIILWAKNAGIKLPATTRNSSPIEELRPWVVGALARGATFLKLPSSASIETNVEVITKPDELSAKMDSVAALQTKVTQLERSLEFLHAEFEDNRKLNKQLAEDIKVLQQQKRAPVLPAPAAEQDAIVISGMEESETETETAERLSEIFHNTMELPGVSVVSATRLGKQLAGEGRPRKLLVKLSSREQAVQVLTSGRRLKQLNIDRQSNGERPIGISANLSPAELQHRSSVWKGFTAAKAESKKWYWRNGYRLFVDDKEVQPADCA